jgi:hypothetical protein
LIPKNIRARAFFLKTLEFLWIGNPLDFLIQSFFFGGRFFSIRWIEPKIPAKNSLGLDLENFSLDFQNSGISESVHPGTHDQEFPSIARTTMATINLKNHQLTKESMHYLAIISNFFVHFILGCLTITERC